MRKVLGFFALATMASLFLLPAAGLADPPPGMDKLGLYSLDDGQGFAHLGAPAATVTGLQTIFLIATGMEDASGVHGWEVCLEVPAAIFYTGETIMGQGINVDTPPCFAVGLANPNPRNAWDGVVLASMNFLLVDTDPHLIFMHPATVPSIPDRMVFALGSDSGDLRPFNWSGNLEENAVFGFNTGALDPPIQNETVTWGEIKSMFR